MNKLIKIILLMLLPIFAVWAQSGAQIKRNIEQLKHKLENIERLAVKYKADNCKMKTKEFF